MYILKSNNTEIFTIKYYCFITFVVVGGFLMVFYLGTIYSNSEDAGVNELITWSILELKYMEKSVEDKQTFPYN